jgi:hypothetical protein
MTFAERMAPYREAADREKAEQAARTIAVYRSWLAGRITKVPVIPSDSQYKLARRFMLI